MLNFSLTALSSWGEKNEINEVHREEEKGRTTQDKLINEDLKEEEEKKLQELEEKKKEALELQQEEERTSRYRPLRRLTNV